MTGKPSQDNELRHQVFDYLTKPARLAVISECWGRVNEHCHSHALAALEIAFAAEGDSKLVGTGPAMERVLKLICCTHG